MKNMWNVNDLKEYKAISEDVSYITMRPVNLCNSGLDALVTRYRLDDGREWARTKKLALIAKSVNLAFEAELLRLEAEGMKE